MSRRLDLDFFSQDVNLVAQELLGKEFNFYNYRAIICETESYSESDPASHCYLGKKTKRNYPMFLEGGTIYIYFIYGMYYCLNIVTGKKGVGEAVLIRGVYIPREKVYLNGPGKICRYLNINKDYNSVSLVNNPYIYIKDINSKFPFKITPRIGISKGKDLLQRFIIEKNVLFYNRKI